LVAFDRKLLEHFEMLYVTQCLLGLLEDQQ
ncbi:hypothetical protein D026_3983B, partial [Vibrio parahaemolyticus 605]